MTDPYEQLREASAMNVRFGWGINPSPENEAQIAALLSAHDAQAAEIERLREALSDAIPYIRGAYECAFPDDAQNEFVLSQAEAALAQGEKP